MSQCINCGDKQSKSQVFSWSVCSHSYCKRCAGETINTALLSYNSIPKCTFKNCNKELNIQDGHKIKSQLLPRFQINKSVDVYHNESALFDGYIRLNAKLEFPLEIIQLISDYFALLSILTRINCYGGCNGKIKIKTCQCQFGMTRFQNGKYVKNCRKCEKIESCESCNGNGSIKNKRKRKQCQRCRGKGRKKTRSSSCDYCHSKGYIMCQLCKGFGTVSVPCFCNGSTFLMVLDFEKLCKRQIYIA